ncbi:hypothetical protein AAMO2058_001589800 [Amorphochlora amoebiformis]
MAKRYCVVLASLSLALVPNPRPSPLQSRTSIHTLAPPLPCRRLGHVFSPEISLKGNGLQRGVRLRRAKGQVEPLATLGKGSKRIKDPMWREGVSPVLKEQMIKIVGANFTDSQLKALQTVIDLRLLPPQREAISELYKTEMDDEALQSVFEVARMHLTAGQRANIVGLLGHVELTPEQRRAFEIVCDMRVDSQTLSKLLSIPPMGLNLEFFFKLGKIASWVEENNIPVDDNDRISLGELYQLRLNISGNNIPVWEALAQGSEGYSDNEPPRFPSEELSRIVTGAELKALGIAYKLNVNSQQIWAMEKLISLGFEEIDLETMRDIGNLCVHLELSDDQRDALWTYARLKVSKDQRKKIDLGARIITELGPEQVSAVRYVTKLKMSPEEEKVFQRLADFRTKQDSLLQQPPIVPTMEKRVETSGAVTMRKMLITQFKDNLWRKYNTIMDKATNLFPLWTILSAALGMLRPQTFDWFTTQWFTASLATLMMSMGVTLTMGDLVRVASQPVPIMIGFLACYVAMPLLALGLAKLFSLNSALTAGLVLVGSLNGGQSSNLCTYIANGDVALSILMTLATTIGATFMIPLISTVLLGQSVNIDAAGIAMSTVQVFLIPMAAGMLLKRFASRAVDAFMPLTPVVGVVSTCLLVGSAVAQSSSAILAEGLTLQWPVMLIHILGAVAGYWMMRFAGQDEITSRTSGIETSMKSSALGFLLAKLHFPDYDVRIPPAVSVVWVALMGASIAVVWRALPVPQEVIEARYNVTNSNPNVGRPPTWLGAYRNHLKYYPLRKPLRKVQVETKKVFDVAKESIKATMEDIKVLRETSKLIEKEKDPSTENPPGQSSANTNNNNDNNSNINNAGPAPSTI